jgi:site-specific DNA-methyltransferase (adenine-specific)
MRKLYRGELATRLLSAGVEFEEDNEDPIVLESPTDDWEDLADIDLRCQEVLEFLRGLADESVDLMFVDPPYFLSNGGTTCKGGKRASVNKGEWDKSNGVEDDYQFQYNWLKEAQRVLKPSGTIYVSGTYHCIYGIGHAMKLLGYNILNDLCWYKRNAPPNLSGRQRAAKHETIIWAGPFKGKKLLHVFNYTAAKNKNRVYRCANKIKKKVCGQIIEEGTAKFCFACGGGLDLTMAEVRQPTSLITKIGTPFPCEKVRGKHPTQKPVMLLKEVIESSSNPGDVVCDPFMGSGTTGLVAYILGRKFIGNDLDPECVKLTKLRLQHPEDVLDLFND